MKTIGKKTDLKKVMILLVLVINVTIMNVAVGQDKKILMYDTFHGQNPKNVEKFNSLLPNNSNSIIELNTKEISDTILKEIDVLILFSPTKRFSDNEKKVIVKYLQSNGSLLLIFDEERRTSLSSVGVNDIIMPFGIELTEDTPVRHNCGAIADSSEICSGKRELPYSGGRSIKGGNIVSRVNDIGNYIHCAYVKLPTGGKIIVMSDGMAGLLLGKPDGVRFSGTGPSDSKFWGKDSRVFMMEILAFLLKG